MNTLQPSNTPTDTDDPADAVLADAAARLETLLADLCPRLRPFPSFLGMTTIQAVELEPALTPTRDLGCLVVTPDGDLAALDIAAIPGIVGVLEVDQVEQFQPVALTPEERLIYLLAAVRQMDAELRRRGG